MRGFRRLNIAFVIASALALEAFAACGTSATEAPSGTGTEVSAPALSFLTHFDKAKGELPEGLWELGSSAGAPTPIVGLAPLASLVSIPTGGVQSFGSIGATAAANTYTLGITEDANGRVYVGVGAAAAGPVPSPGIYRFDAKGGAATVFSAGSAATPAMNFPNGLDFIGTNLFVADSEGAIYSIDETGAATAWNQDPLLASSQPACAGIVPLAVGANGIAHDANNIYVTNTNFGRLVKIPILADGKAGTPAVIVEDCAALAGADGLILDDDGTFLVAVNAQNKIVRVTPDGITSVVASGAPLDTPASLYLEHAPKRLVITNSSFFSAADAGTPGVLAMPLP